MILYEFVVLILVSLFDYGLIVCFLLLFLVDCCWYCLSLFKCETWSRCLPGREFLRDSSKFQTSKGLDANRSVPERQKSQKVVSIGGGFIFFFKCSFLFGEMIQFD